MIYGIVIQIILTGISLAMDAFAVSICDGMIYRHINKKKLVIIPITFGLFQAAMPIIGFYVGMAVMQYIEDIDHWFAFIILVVIGGKMIYDGIGELRAKAESPEPKPFSVPAILIQGVATSIDALAVGFSLNTMLNGVNSVQAWAWLSVCIIGVITFIISSIGLWFGVKVGALFRKKAYIAEIAGGAVLILIAIKIVLASYGIINF